MTDKITFGCNTQTQPDSTRILKVSSNVLKCKENIKPTIPITNPPINLNIFYKQNTKYSPFSLEFKKIISSQVFDYGQNISIEIPIVGNLIYRCFFEIELPTLSFTDSIITDSKYIDYKQNKLSNITTEINYWTQQINNMVLYSDIQLNGYVEAKKILKLNNITLNFLQNRILNIYNGYQDSIYKYKLLIDSNIINSIDILGYIIGLSTFNISDIETTLDSMYNNNINYLEYYQSNKIYSTNQYNTINTGKLLCRWIDYIGHFYFNFYEMNINGFTLDNYSNDYLHIKQIHSIHQDYKENYDKMIGNTDDIYNNTPTIIYTPLIFNFSNINDSSNSLPLVGMINSSIKINSRINDLKSLVYLQDWEQMYNILLLVTIKRKDHIIDEKLNTIIRADLPYVTVSLLPGYIYQYKCNIVDKRVLDTVYAGIDSNTILKEYGSYSDEYNTMVLTLDDWIVLMNVITTETKLQESTKITLAGYHYFIDYNYLLNLIGKPKVALLVEYGYIDNYEKTQMATSNLEYMTETHHEISLDINENSLYDSLNNLNGLIKDIYVFTRQRLFSTGISKYGKNDMIHYGGNTIDSITLNISNEYNLFEYYNTTLDTYNNVQSFYNLTSSIPNGVWFKTFSLNTDNIQPSGCVNMNVITGQNVSVAVNENNSIYYNIKTNPNKLGTEFKLLYTKYNILKVQNGSANLVFYS